MSFVRVDKALSKLGYATRSETLSFLRKHRVFQWLNKGGSDAANSVRIQATAHKITIQGLKENQPILNVDDLTYLVSDLRGPMTILVNKGSGLVCSTARDNYGETSGPKDSCQNVENGNNLNDACPPEGTRLIYDILPQNFIHMHPTLSCIGRLDKDTSGLILMTQDGELQNYINSVHVPKTYMAQIKPSFESREEFELKVQNVFASGTLLLRNERRPCKPSKVQLIDDGSMSRVSVTIHEGMYHQVRRMFAACGYRVMELERVRIGNIELYDTSTGASKLETNQWRRVLAEEISDLKSFKQRTTLNES